MYIQPGIWANEMHCWKGKLLMYMQWNCLNHYSGIWSNLLKRYSLIGLTLLVFEVKWETVCWIVFFTSFLSSSSVLYSKCHLIYYLFICSCFLSSSYILCLPMFCVFLFKALKLCFCSAFLSILNITICSNKQTLSLIITSGCFSHLGSSSGPWWGWWSPSCCSRGRGTPPVDSQQLKTFNTSSPAHISSNRHTWSRDRKVFFLIFEFFHNLPSVRCAENMNFEANCNSVK